MVRNKHHEDSTNGQEGDNDLEAMISSFGLREVFLRRVLLQEHCLKWTSSCLLSPIRYGNLAGSTKCIAYLKLAFISNKDSHMFDSS